MHLISSYAIWGTIALPNAFSRAVRFFLSVVTLGIPSSQVPSCCEGKSTNAAEEIEVRSHPSCKSSMMIAPSSPQTFSAEIFQMLLSSSRRQSKLLMKLSRSGLCLCGVETICSFFFLLQLFGIGTMNRTWKASGSSQSPHCCRISSAKARYTKTEGRFFHLSDLVILGLAIGEILKIFSMGSRFQTSGGTGGGRGVRLHATPSVAPPRGGSAKICDLTPH